MVGLSEGALLGSFPFGQKVVEQRLTQNEMKAVKLHSACRHKCYAFCMQPQQEYIREANFYFPEYGISISQCSPHTTEKVEPTGKITLHISSQG